MAILEFLNPDDNEAVDLWMRANGNIPEFEKLINEKYGQKKPINKTLVLYYDGAVKLEGSGCVLDYIVLELLNGVRI